MMNYISEKELTQSFRMHLKRIGLNEEVYELAQKRVRKHDILG